MSADNPMHVNSNKISYVLAQSSPALADVHHVRLTSTPGDDLVEEDFGERVRSLLQPMTSLVSLIVCIPSMARLHPSNSLPKVLNVLHEVSTLHPHCRLGLAVHEAEQVWTALPILTRIVELRLSLYTIEFSRAFFPVGALVQAAQSCGLESLKLHATQVFCSEAAGSTTNNPSIETLTSLIAHAHSESSPGLDSLVQTAASTLANLDLSSSSSGTLRGLVFPHLLRLNIHEDLLLEATAAQMPALQDLILPTLTRPQTCEVIQEILQSWPHLRAVRVLRVVAGDMSEALVRLAETHASVKVTIGELAVLEPAHLTPAALGISEHLVNAGPPIAGDWPPGFEQQQYPRLKLIVLKVHDGHNHDEFIASLDAPNLEGPPSISMIKKKGKGGKR